MTALGLAAGVSAAGPAGTLVGFALVVALTVGARNWRDEQATVNATVESAPVRSQPPSLASSLDHDGRLVVRPAPQTLAAGAAMVLGGTALALGLQQVGTTVVWTLIGLLVAVGLDRPVAALARLLRGRRPLALALVGLLVAGVVIAAVLLAGRGDVAGSLPDQPTDMAQAFADLPLIGGPLERAGTAEAPSTALADLPDKLADSVAPARLVEVVMGSAAGLF